MRSLLSFLLLLSLALSSVSMADASGRESGIGVPGLKQIQAAREKVEKDRSLEAEQKQPLLNLYDETEAWLNKARDFEKRAREYADLRARAPRKTAAVRKRLAEGLEAPKIDIDALNRKPLAELAQMVDTAKAELVAREGKVSELERRLNEDGQLPDIVRERLAQAKGELDALTSGQSISQPPSGDTQWQQAARWRDRAKAVALENEIRMLEKQLLSLPARKALDEALHEEARKQVALAESRLQALQTVFNARRKKEAEKLTQAEEAAQRAVEGKNPLLEQLAAENAALSAELSEVTTELEKASIQSNQLRAQAKTLQNKYRTTREKVEIAGMTEALGQVLVDQLEHLPDQRNLRRALADIRKQVSETGLRQIRHQEALRKLEGTMKNGFRAWPKNLSPNEKARLEPQLNRLLERKRELLKKLLAADGDQLKALGELEVAMQGLLRSVEEYDHFLAAHMLWVRNTPMFRPAELKKLPRELGILLKPAAWREVMESLGQRVRSSPLVQVVLAGLVLVSLMSRNLIRRIRRITPGNTRVGPGTFTAMLQVLALSLLQPLWLLSWLAFFYWQLRLEGGVSLYGDSLVAAMKWSAPVLYSLLATRVLTMPGGLLLSYFRWNADTVRRLRRAVDTMLWFFVPASVITSIAIYVLPGGLGAVTVKLAFVVLAVTLSLFIHQVLHPRRGVISGYLRSNARGYLSRLRWLWFLVLVVSPLLLMALALLGYVYTSATMLRFLVNTFWLLAVLLLIQQLAEFWLVLARRRIAYKAAQARRQAMQAIEEAGSAGQAEGEGARENQVGEETTKVNLAELSKESRKLLNALLFLAGLVGMWMIWSPMLPALGVLDEIVLWQQTVTLDGHQEKVGVTLGNVLSVLAIFFLTLLATRNLPSLIEILLLQYFPVSPGSRYAVRTLSGYLIAGVGVVALFNALGGNWSQIQWLVAALGVGIGFGLQEIVANFISGLIILFERPIRVGDYVTVGGADGTVTRIRIRATTILTRDRKELLVPNKEFITSQLLNWTLSDETARIKVVVGIRYGADVVLAEKIMLEAARAHPRVLKEPGPWVNFDDFGDSALLLELRCIIDSAEYRVLVKSELRHAIDQGFRAAGMEIPFPQRDVHLDTLGPLEVLLQPRT